MTVSDIMTTSLMVGRPKDAIRIADFDMKTAGIRHLLVVNDSNVLLGVVSDRDMLRAVGSAGGKDLVLGAIMSPRVISVDENTPAREALAIMIERKISCLPVERDDGELLGVVTESDFMRVLYDELWGESE